MAVAVKINDLVKHFGNVKAIDHVTVTIEPGEIFFLLGPSGCGKTTLLRTIAGFHQPDAGSVFIGDRDASRAPTGYLRIMARFKDEDGLLERMPKVPAGTSPAD